MWIIEDMFKSRKGFELKNSLTEYIPDTYFELWRVGQVPV